MNATFIFQRKNGSILQAKSQFSSLKTKRETIYQFAIGFFTVSIVIVIMLHDFQTSKKNIKKAHLKNCWISYFELTFKDFIESGYDTFNFLKNGNCAKSSYHLFYLISRRQVIQLFIDLNIFRLNRRDKIELKIWIETSWFLETLPGSMRSFTWLLSKPEKKSMALLKNFVQSTQPVWKLTQCVS